MYFDYALFDDDGVDDEHSLSFSSDIESVASIQLFSTIAATRLTYSLRFSVYNCAAKAFAGEFGFGSSSKD